MQLNFRFLLSLDHLCPKLDQSSLTEQDSGCLFSFLFLRPVGPNEIKNNDRSLAGMAKRGHSDVLQFLLLSLSLLSLYSAARLALSPTANAGLSLPLAHSLTFLRASRWGLRAARKHG